MTTKNKTSKDDFNATSHKTDVIGSRFKPILFSTPMVQAILDGRKSQTRRIVKPMRGMQSEWLSMDLINKVKEGQIVKGGWQMFHPNGGEKSPLGWIKSNYQIGDILWVRETWQQECELIQIAGGDWSNAYLNATGNYVYKSDNIILPSETETFSKWKPSIFMPKEACRIFLKVTDVRVERLQDISEKDAKAEGIERDKNGFMPTPDKFWAFDGSALFNSAKDAFAHLWKKINRENSWKENPWVWVYTFERVERPHDFR